MYVNGVGPTKKQILNKELVNSQTDHLSLCITADSDGLSEVTRELACTVVCHVDCTALTWLDRSLCVCWNSTSATCNSLIDYKRLVTSIGECKRALHDRILFRELSEVVCSLIKLNLWS